MRLSKAISKSIGKSSNDQVLRALRFNAETLDDAQHSFQETLQEYKLLQVRSFRETIDTYGEKVPPDYHRG